MATAALRLVGNLFATGSSLFPTSSGFNPYLTIASLGSWIGASLLDAQAPERAIETDLARIRSGAAAGVGLPMGAARARSQKSDLPSERRACREIAKASQTARTGAFPRDVSRLIATTSRAELGFLGLELDPRATLGTRRNRLSVC